MVISQLRSLLIGLVGGLVALSAVQEAQAADLRLAPTHVIVASGERAGRLRIWNDGVDALNVQVRVFSVTQKNGKMVFVPTDKVIASPPITRLGAKSSNLVRIVRVAAKANTSPEDYKLVVDQLPSGAPARAGTVKVLLRYIVPVKFK